MPNVKLTKKQDSEVNEEESKVISPNIEDETPKEESLEVKESEENLKDEEIKVESEIEKQKETPKEEETGVEKVDFDKDESLAGENLKIKTLVDGLDFKSKNVKELLDKIVLNALESKSSDIHIEPRDIVTISTHKNNGITFLSLSNHIHSNTYIPIPFLLSSCKYL